MPRFVPRQRKHRVRRRNEDSHRSLADSNVLEIVPREPEEERRQQMFQQLRAEQPSKISTKKQKRLEKYIEKKMKKEENLELLKRLASTKVDVSLMRSSRTLGVAKVSKREQLSRALRERRAGVEVEANELLLLQNPSKRGLSPESEESESGNDVDEPEPELEAPKLQPASDVAPTSKSTTSSMSRPLGSGLKRPLDIGGDGNPIIPNLKRRKPNNVFTSPPEEDTWEGFETEGNSDGSSSSGSSLGSQSDDSGSSSERADDSSLASENDSYGGFVSSQKQRASAFKVWADQQRNEVLGFQPSGTVTEAGPPELEFPRISLKPRPIEEDPLPPELQTTSTTRKVYSVEIRRSPEVVSARLALPVVAEEQKIMEAIHNNPIVVIWGATGSGKTTQVPQFLFEAGYGDKGGPTPGMIGVTQPRRVAAVSMAKRVGDEMGADRAKVAYKIRFEGSVNEKTAIKFMTDGILLREASADITLSNYSAIIIDEAHERTKDTDILIGMLSRIVKLRADLAREDARVQPLKLIIMSATLRISDFTDNSALFPSKPPVVQAEGRQHAVTVHWARKTSHDYLDEAYRKICKGHKRLPPGGMLVFLTGQSEITQLSKKIRQAFPLEGDSQGASWPNVQISGDDAPLEVDDMEVTPISDQDSIDSTSESDIEVRGLDKEDEDFEIGESASEDTGVHVLPLYSLLPTKEQLRVFEEPPKGARLIVLATNVAETSLTIPDIRFVFDCGRAKERKYDEDSGVQSFQIGWISKASANQRTGRAGRTGPGHCYRLYSSAVYERDFAEHTEPEILRTPIEGVVLQLSGLNVPGIVEKFPFPTPPNRERLKSAQRLLTNLGALTPKSSLTHLGRQMSLLPLSPRFAKILLTGHKFSTLPYTIALVAALSVNDIFIPESHLDLTSQPLSETAVFTNSDRLAEDARDSRRKAYHSAHARLSHELGAGKSDVLKLLAVVLGHAASLDPDEYCENNFLRPTALRDTHLLRRRLHSLLTTSGQPVPSFLHTLPPPSAKQITYLTQIITASYLDQLAIRADLAPVPRAISNRPHRVHYLPLFPPGVTEDETQVYIHPSSTLLHSSSTAKNLPACIAYSHLQLPSSSVAKSHLNEVNRSKRILMHPVTVVNPAHIATLGRGSPLLDWSKPIKSPKVLRLSPDDAGKVLVREECILVPTLRGSKGTRGWPLPAEKVIRERMADGSWVIK